MAELSKEARQKRIEWLYANDSRMTMEKAAISLGVSAKTVQRDLQEMREQKKVLKKDIPKDPVQRDEIFERAVNTHDMIQWAIREAREMLEKLRHEMDEAGGHKCKECGRGGSDPLKWQAYFKGLDSMVNQLTLLAKLLGQISDAPQLAIWQIDSDLEKVMRALAALGEGLPDEVDRVLLLAAERRGQEIRDEDRILVRGVMSKVGEMAARQLYLDLLGESPRRQKRMGEFVQIVDAPQLPPPVR